MAISNIKQILIQGKIKFALQYTRPVLGKPATFTQR